MKTFSELHPFVTSILVGGEQSALLSGRLTIAGRASITHQTRGLVGQNHQFGRFGHTIFFYLPKSESKQRLRYAGHFKALLISYFQFTCQYAQNYRGEELICSDVQGRCWLRKSGPQILHVDNYLALSVHRCTVRLRAISRHFHGVRKLSLFVCLRTCHRVVITGHNEMFDCLVVLRLRTK